MKVKPLSRSEAVAVRRDRRDIRALPRNLAPQLHPHQRAREYTRALNATKLERTFAQPLLHKLTLQGHSDGVYSLATLGASSDASSASSASASSFQGSGGNATALLSGSCDGEIRLWNVSHAQCVWKASAHDGFVRGLSRLSCGANVATRFLSGGDDYRIKMWDVTGDAGEDKIVTGSQDVHESRPTSLLLHETQKQQQRKTERKRQQKEQLELQRLKRRQGKTPADDGSDNGNDDHDASDSDASDDDSDAGVVGRRGFLSSVASGALGQNDVSWLAKDPVTGVDASKDPSSTLFISSGGESVSVWDLNASTPVRTIKWGIEAVTGVSFNPVETSLFCSLGNDRTVALYDLRAGSAGSGGVVRKVMLQMRNNAVSWNPMEAFNFTVASDDHFLYSFDMRKLDRARCVHEGHTAAVLDVHWSPTGQEFATASYDKTVRIFENNSGYARETYHTKRMQRLFAVRFSNDGRFVFTGSDDTNIRVWKARASESLAPQNARQERSANYNEALKKQFAFAPEIRRISKSRRLPAAITKDTKIKRVMKDSRQRKLKHVIAHKKEGSVQIPKEREKQIVRVQE